MYLPHLIVIFNKDNKFQFLPIKKKRNVREERGVEERRHITELTSTVRQVNGFTRHSKKLVGGRIGRFDPRSKKRRRIIVVGCAVWICLRRRRSRRMERRGGFTFIRNSSSCMMRTCDRQRGGF